MRDLLDLVDREVLLVTVVRPDQWVRQEDPDPRDHQVPLVLSDKLDHREQPDFVDHLDHLVPWDLQVNQVPLDLQDLADHEVPLEDPALGAHHPDLLAPLEGPELVVPEAHADLQVQVVLLAC